MPRQVKLGKHSIMRECVQQVGDLFQNEEFEAMVAHQIQTVLEHCRRYPQMDKYREVTLKIKVKPEARFQDDLLVYDRAKLMLAVLSPILPQTDVEYQCVVSNGVPFFNVEDKENPLQMTIRDEYDVPIADGKTAGAGN